MPSPGRPSSSHSHALIGSWRSTFLAMVSPTRSTIEMSICSDLARRFLNDVLDAIGLDSVAIVAHSVGSLWSVVFTLAYPARVSRLVLLGAPAGVQRPNVPIQLRLLGLPVVGQFLGRRLMSNPTREGSRQFWGDVLVRHPERVDDALLDADVASARRNLDSHLSLVQQLADAGGLRRGAASWATSGSDWASRTDLVWGDADKFLSPSAATQLVRCESLHQAAPHPGRGPHGLDRPARTGCRRDRTIWAGPKR